MKKKFSRICNVNTQYSLLLYLVYSSWDEICDTFFIFAGNAFKRFNAKQKFKYYNQDFRWISIPVISFYVNILHYWYIKKTRLPKFSHAQLFTQDHLLKDNILIWKHPYTLIEDAPHCFRDTYWYSKSKISREYEEERKKELTYKLLKKHICGPAFYNRFGNNPLCTDVLLTYDDDLDYLKNKKLHYMDFRGKWDSFPEEKKQFILKVFELDEDDIKIFSSRKIVIFTQPLTIKYLSKERHKEIYSSIIRNYPQNDIIIKVHPRDLYPYENDFPDAVVFRKATPSQLFDLLGISFDKVVTLFSTAVVGVKFKELDWYGTEYVPELKNIFGKIEPPKQN